MYATFASARVMKSPSRGTIRSWPVRPGKYARANIARKRCRAAESGGAERRIRRASRSDGCLTCSPETVQVIATRPRARRLAPQRGNFERTEVRHLVMLAPSLQHRMTVLGPKTLNSWFDYCLRLGCSLL